MDLRDFASRFRKVRWSGDDKFDACCSAHDDNDPSLHAENGKKGGIVVHCHAGCEPEAIVTAVGLGLGDLAPPDRPLRLAASSGKVPPYLARWKEAGPIAGTLGETYLRSRGITIPIPPSLKFHPHLLYQEDDDRQYLPAVIACIQTHEIVGIQRIYVAPDGLGKANVPKPKKALSTGKGIKGGAVRLGPVAQRIGVAEGIETALSAMQADELPVWATLGTSGMTGLKVPVGEIKEVIIYADADDAGVMAANALAQRLLLSNVVRVGLKVPPAGRDFNDLLREDGADAIRAIPIQWPQLQAQPDNRPVVDIGGGDLKFQSGNTWAAIQKSNQPPWLLSTATGLSLISRDLFGRAYRSVANIDRLRWALTWRFDFRRHVADGSFIATRPADVILANLISNPQPPIGFMRRLAEVPILTPDSRVIANEGFDTESGIYYLPHPDLHELEIPEQSPESADIADAVAIIDDLLADFPFVDDCDRAHAFAFALVPIMRLTIHGRTPLFRFEAPHPRTGKSLLMRLLTRLTCSAISDMGPTTEEEEWRKRITAALRQEPDAVLIDNAESLESANLKKLLTDDIWEDRALGVNETVRAPVQCVLGVSLNNPIISREFIGRSLRVRIDAGCEQPELRGGFRHPNIEEYARKNRAALVGALVTIARVATQPLPTDAPILGGFEAFSRKMGGVMQAIGIKGFLMDRADQSALSDEESSLVELVKEWGSKYQDEWIGTGQIVAMAENIDGIFLGRGNESERGKKNIIARLLRKHRDATIAGWRIAAPRPGRETSWRLKPIIISS